MNLASNFLWLSLAYLLGSIPTGYMVGKRVKKIDIRQHGSGNVGATNVFRVMGKKWGAIVLICDILKGTAATAIIATAPDAFVNLSHPLKQLLFGGAAICGHTFSPWLKFKGGKGVATAAGALLGIFPLAAVSAILVWTVSFLISRYVSISSILAAVCFPVLLLIFDRHVESFGLIFSVSLILAGLIVYNHRANIQRLIDGKENRANFGKKKKNQPS